MKKILYLVFTFVVGAIWFGGNSQLSKNQFVFTVAEKNGTYDYSNQISNGINEWTSHFSFMKFSKVTSGNNLLILSTNFGDTGWVGYAHNSGSPKQININEWYHINNNLLNLQILAADFINEFPFRFF